MNCQTHQGTVLTCTSKMGGSVQGILVPTFNWRFFGALYTRPPSNEISTFRIWKGKYRDDNSLQSNGPLLPVVQAHSTLLSISQAIPLILDNLDFPSPCWTINLLLHMNQLKVSIKSFMYSTTSTSLRNTSWLFPKQPVAEYKLICCSMKLLCCLFCSRH